MNALLDFAGSLIYLAFMTFLLPILVVLYTLLGFYRTGTLMLQLLAQVPALLATLNPARTLVPARRSIGLLRRRFAGMHA